MNCRLSISAAMAKGAHQSIIEIDMFRPTLKTSQNLSINYFSQYLSISSNVLPLVSGTTVRTKTKAITHIAA